MTVITLMTDFGEKDGYVGVLKGVIWSIYPTAQIADITHEISPQNILEGALILQRIYPFFPVGTVHLAVVDPGVGTGRRPITMRVNGHTFVGPDNGLFTAVIENAEANRLQVAIYHLTKKELFLPTISSTFHGRDIFAPVSAHLAKGISIAEVGPLISDPVRIQLPKHEKTPIGWKARVIGIDRFGNIATDLPVGIIGNKKKCKIRIGRYEILGIANTYEEGSSRELLALANSEGCLELAVAQGSAAQIIKAKLGDIVEIDDPVGLDQ
jgi:S-adenosyl-L-methionine hydrolase (adenosine-forming)